MGEVEEFITVGSVGKCRVGREDAGADALVEPKQTEAQSKDSPPEMPSRWLAERRLGVGPGGEC